MLAILRKDRFLKHPSSTLYFAWLIASHCPNVACGPEPLILIGVELHLQDLH